MNFFFVYQLIYSLGGNVQVLKSLVTVTFYDSQKFTRTSIKCTLDLGSCLQEKSNSSMSKKGIFFFSPLTTMHCGLPNVVIYKEIANARRHFLPRNANYIRESGEKFIHIRVPTCVISSLQICMNTLKSILIPKFLVISNFDNLQIRSIF